MAEMGLSKSETRAFELIAQYEEASRCFDKVPEAGPGADALDDAIDKIVMDCPVESSLVAAKLLR